MSFQSYSYEDRLRIRKAYEAIMPKILRGEFRDVYALWPHDWCAYMSPIEFNLWQDIRACGFPMFPQFPVDKYFVDFADPVKRIAIEADGREYHQGKGRDAIRQRAIEAAGYRVYRFNGWETYVDEDEDGNVTPDSFVAIMRDVYAPWVYS